MSDTDRSSELIEQAPAVQWLSTSILVKQIQSLPEERFADLCNALLSETAAVRGVHRSCFATNLNVKEGDGGIDARCVGATVTVGRLIPRPTTVYQFKGGRQNKSAREIIWNDILEQPRVVDYLRCGDAFVYLAAWDRGDKFESDLISSLRTEISNRHGDQQLASIAVEDGQVVFIGGDTIARLLTGFPGLVARFLGLDSSLNSMEEWGSFPALANPYLTDADLDAQIRDLRGWIEEDRSRTRLVGAAGNGKTRLALEVLRGSNLADSVVYARQAGEVSNGFISFLRQTQDVRCTVVVDEVDDAAAVELGERFQGMPAEVRLMTIGADVSRRRRSGTFEVRGLSETVLIDAIRSVAPGVPTDTARSIARNCERSPKLAVLIASRLRDNPELVSPSNWLADGDIADMLQRYLPLSTDSAAWQALSMVALLTRVGWLDDADEESEVLFSATGLNVAQARRDLNQLHERFGIVPIAGRFRYVSPALLADYLATLQLDAWTQRQLVSVFKAMNGPMADSFAQRIRRIAGGLERNRRVIEEVVLGDQGPFQTLSEVERFGLAQLLRHFAAPFPRATLAALRRLILPVPVDELRAASQSRRHLVWMLEELLWRADTFDDAARILLRLAVAENETWANNATAIWVETFQMVLGRTAAALAQRARVLRRAAGDDDPAARRLAALAIGGGLRVRHLRRLGDAPEELEGGPVEDWRPADDQEWAAGVAGYIEILSPLLKDSDIEVRLAAGRALADGVEATLSLPPPAPEAWSAAATTLVGADYGVRTPILREIDLALRLWGQADEGGASGGDAEEDSSSAPVGPPQERISVLAALAAALRGEDFSSRFRETLTHAQRRAMEAARQGDAEQDGRRRLGGLVGEVIAMPALLASEIEWLLEVMPWGAMEWFSVLGSLDRDRRFESLLNDLVTRSPATLAWSSLYDLSYARAVDDDGFIDRRVAELRSRGAPGNQLFDVLMRAGYTPDRLDTVVDLIETGTVPPTAVAQLAYTPWGAAIPPSEARKLAAAAVGRANEPDDVLPFLANYLTQVERAAPEFREAALGLLAATPADSAALPSLNVWTWARLARLYVNDAPAEVAAATLAQVAARGPAWENYLRTVLEEAWAAGDKRRLFEEVVAPWLAGSQPGGWLVRQTLAGFPVADAGIDAVMAWVAGDPAQRVSALAEVVGVPSERPSDLHAALLEQYSDLGVAKAFYRALTTGIVWGSKTAWMQEKLKRARQWLADERAPVRDWAQWVVDALEEQVDWTERREAEERFEQ